MFTYNAMLIAAILYCCLYGGRTGKAASGIIVALVIISQSLAMISPSMTWLMPRMFAVDLLSLGLKIALAMVSNRRWPILLAAFQLNTVCAEVAVLLSPTFRDSFYHAMAIVWAAPTLLVMMAGTFLDRRAERRTQGMPEWNIG